MKSSNYWPIVTLLHGQLVPIDLLQDQRAAPQDGKQRDAAPEVERAEDNHPQASYTTVFLALTLLLLSGLTLLTSSTRITTALSEHAQSAVSDLGVPHRWQF